ncbi:hypothetical protein [Pontibacter russatus]|uniref:hypothetical protein n=1 Tax=Pontibacter russatus TaxID=2694929 RepID=UPI00137B5D41|nr:hypothetical protein [Pontibacter russatus]
MKKSSRRNSDRLSQGKEDLALAVNLRQRRQQQKKWQAAILEDILIHGADGSCSNIRPATP